MSGVTSFAHDGWRFDVTDTGPVDGPPVLLLHGFPADRHCWDAVAAGLAEHGYRALAPDQRGYSPGARPRERRAYGADRLGRDVLALADQAGASALGPDPAGASALGPDRAGASSLGGERTATARFHLVGHDWGAGVAWHLAAQVPDRVATLTALSVPHPAAMRTPAQAPRSWYMAAFQLPWLPERILTAKHGAALRLLLTASGLEGPVAARYAANVADDPRALAGALGWYRALPLASLAGTGPVRVPTLVVWGTDDPFIGRQAVVRGAAWAAGDYRLVELPGAGHWLPEQHPDAVLVALLDHLAAHPLQSSAASSRHRGPDRGAERG